MKYKRNLRCKICKLPDQLRDTIDQQLLNGASHASVVKALAENGVPISKSSVGRHAKDHLGIVPENLKRPDSEVVSDAIEKVPPRETIRYDSVDEYRALAQSQNLLESAVIERRVSQLMLERIVQNQLSIVSTMQREFMRGDGEYPRDPITGLKSVMDLLAKLPNYESGQNKVASQRVDEQAQLRIDVRAVVDELGAVKGGDYRIGVYLQNADSVPKLNPVVDESDSFANWSNSPKRGLSSPLYQHVVDAVPMGELEELEWSMVILNWRCDAGDELDTIIGLMRESIEAHPNDRDEQIEYVDQRVPDDDDDDDDDDDYNDAA